MNTVPAPLIGPGTARQLMTANHGALYVVRDRDDVIEVGRLSRELNRADIQVIPAIALVNPKVLSCKRPSQLVIDHRVNITSTVRTAMLYAESHRIPVAAP